MIVKERCWFTGESGIEDAQSGEKTEYNETEESCMEFSSAMASDSF